MRSDILVEPVHYDPPEHRRPLPLVEQAGAASAVPEGALDFGHQATIRTRADRSMKVVLRTDSPHLSCFFEAQWGGGAPDGVPDATMYAFARLPEAYGLDPELGGRRTWFRDRHEVWQFGTEYYGNIKVSTRGLCSALAADDEVFVHGCSLQIGDRGVILSGRSGTGKTTLTAAMRSASPVVRVINDDWGAVGLSGGETYYTGEARLHMKYRSAFAIDPDLGIGPLTHLSENYADDPEDIHSRLLISRASVFGEDRVSDAGPVSAYCVLTRDETRPAGIRPSSSRMTWTGWRGGVLGDVSALGAISGWRAVLRNARGHWAASGQAGTARRGHVRMDHQQCGRSLEDGSAASRLGDGAMMSLGPTQHSSVRPVCVVKSRRFPSTAADAIDGGTLNALRLVESILDRGHPVEVFTRREAGQEPMERRDGLTIHRVEWRPSAETHTMRRDYEEGDSFVRAVLSHPSFWPFRYRSIHVHHWTSAVGLVPNLPAGVRVVYTPICWPVRKGGRQASAVQQRRLTASGRFYSGRIPSSRCRDPRCARCEPFVLQGSPTCCSFPTASTVHSSTCRTESWPHAVRTNCSPSPGSQLRRGSLSSSMPSGC